MRDSQWASGDGWSAYPSGVGGEWRVNAETHLYGHGADALRDMARRLRTMAEEMEEEAAAAPGLA